MALVVAHDPAWAVAFIEEANAIRALRTPDFWELHHIGSTAVPGMPAKPIIDMLGVVASLAAFGRATQPLVSFGYDPKGAYGIEGRLYFRKSNASGVRTHHLHVYETGSPHIERHLAFRDYMTTHPAKAAEYAALKHSLQSKGARNRAYQDGKAEFVASAQAEALIWHRQAR